MWRPQSAHRSYTPWPCGTPPPSSSAANRSPAYRCPPSSTPGCWGSGTPGSGEEQEKKVVKEAEILLHSEGLTMKHKGRLKIIEKASPNNDSHPSISFE